MATTDIDLRRDMVLKTIRSSVSEHLLPQLEEASKILDKKLIKRFRAEYKV